MQIKAIAIKSGYPSSQVISATYTINSGGGGPVRYEWQMLYGNQVEEPCMLSPLEAITYYTAASALANTVVLYTDSDLTITANTGFYLDINSIDRQVYQIQSRGELKITEFRCR
jgi:hypothetical protein